MSLLNETGILIGLLALWMIWGSVHALITERDIENSNPSKGVIGILLPSVLLPVSFLLQPYPSLQKNWLIGF
jgi:hypothetical protein